MANPRQEDKSTQSIEDAARRTSERTAEQTSRMGKAAVEQMTRIGQTAAEAAEEMARAGANPLQQNAETLQDAWRFGLNRPGGRCRSICRGNALSIPTPATCPSSTTSIPRLGSPTCWPASRI